MQTGEISTPKYDSRLDLAAALLLGLLLAVATLFPENFVTGVPLFASQRTFPLTLLLPLLVWGTTVYLVSRRRLIWPGIADALVITLLGYLLFRNIFGLENFVVFKFAVCGLAIFYMSSVLAVSPGPYLRGIIYLVLGLILVTAVYGLAEYAYQKNFIYAKYLAESVPEPARGLHRIGSMLAHPVPYGAFLVQTLPYSVLVWVKESGKARWLALAAVTAGVLALFLTYSKGSWITAVVIGLGALIFVHTRLSRRYLIPAAVFAAVIAAMFAIFWHQVISETEIRSYQSFDVRIASWRGAVSGFANNPVAGVGFKQGSEALKQSIAPEKYEALTPNQPVDNYYLSLLLEEGAIGLALWLLMLIFIILEGAAVVRARLPGSPLAIAALASLVGISVNSITFESMQLWPNFVFFWLAAGILHGLAMSRRAGRTFVAHI